MFTAVPITGSVTRVECPGNVFAYLIEGREKALLVDAGFGYGDLRGFAESLTALPYELLLTHGHFDHAGGAAGFGTVRLSRKDVSVLREGNDPDYRFARLKAADPAAERELMTEAADPCDLHDLRDGDLFDLGGVTAEAVALPGHTPGFTGLLLREERIFLAGDGLCSLTLLNFPYSSGIREYRDSLCRAAERLEGKADVFLYSHPHHFGGPEILPEMTELCGEILSGDCAGLERPDGFLLAKPMDGARRTDGRAANLVYRPEK